MSIRFNADEVFRMGMDVERNGEAYYRKAAELAADPAVKKVLHYLMEEERKHYDIFRDMQEKLSGEEARPTVSDPEDQEHLYLDGLVRSRLFNDPGEAERVAAASDGIEALRNALVFEKDTILFFLGMKDLTPHDLGRDKIDLLIAEERAHVVKISEEIARARERTA
ncbi:MAG: ferritin family protein [Candidatus Krumholzibacteriota bacterium]|nr:ferritin family protein [Candidatus Krumholzibacteriota bacterium]